MFGSDNFKRNFYHCAFLSHSHSLAQQQCLCGCLGATECSQQLSRSLNTPPIPNDFSQEEEKLFYNKFFCVKNINQSNNTSVFGFS